MGKTRMTVLDVRACVAGLRNQLLGARVANVYDLDPKTYLIKTAKGGEKVLLLLESGVRFHSTSFNRDKSNTPSGFTLKLRKHIRTKKVEEVRQLGVDRLVAFTFGAGDEAYHLVLELFAGGNIILLDHECKIISLLRTHTDEQSGAKTAVHETYPMNGQRENRKISMELLCSVLVKSVPHDKALLKDILTKDLDYGLALVEHAMLGAGIEMKRKLVDFDCSASSEEMQRLFRSLEEVDELISNLGAEGRAVPGYIVRKDMKEDSPYDDFAPVLLRQFQTKAVVQFDCLDKAMDAYFTVAEGQRIEQQKAQQQKAAISKVERVKRAHEASIQALQEEEARNYHKATLIEANLSDVDNAILVVNSLLSQGMDWGALKRVVKEEARKGNPIASLIHSLKLDTNQITLMLTFGLDYLGEEEQTAPVTTVDIDLGCNAYTNAQAYYSTKKKVAQKADKTIQSGDKALKGAERKAKEELKRVDTKTSIQLIRKTHWFEKFVWFVSSENFLVVAGRDAQQNELLVKRHMDKGDIYLHADIHGAAAHIVKNHTKDPIPPLTIAQAGLSCVCRSAAWDAKMVTSAYWVHPEQVSKSAPTGEYLSTGSFMIRGRKNYLPPNPLVMGFGLLFRVDESCIAHHLGERRIRGLADDAQAGAAAPAGEEEEGEGEELVDDDDAGGSAPGSTEPEVQAPAEAPAAGNRAAANGGSAPAGGRAAAKGGRAGGAAAAKGGGEGGTAGRERPARQEKKAVRGKGEGVPPGPDSESGPLPPAEKAAAADDGAAQLEPADGGEALPSTPTTPATPTSAAQGAEEGAPRAGGRRAARMAQGAAERMRVGAAAGGGGGGEHNVDEGTKGFDGIRVGAAVTMAAFLPAEDEDDAAARAATGRGEPSGKRHLSAAERKRLKKRGGAAGAEDGDSPAPSPLSGPTEARGSAEDAGGGEDPAPARPATAPAARAERAQEPKGATAPAGGGKKGKDVGAAAAAPAAKAKAAAAAPAGPPQAKRGQAGKKKKMAKYAEQDEEERALALATLGHRPLVDPDADGCDSGGASPAPSAEAAGGGGGDDGGATGLAPEVDALLRRLVGEGKVARRELDATTLAKLAEFAPAEGVEILERFGEADILPQVKNKAAFLSGICHRYRDRRAKAEKDEVRRLREEEGIAELDEEDRGRLESLDSLTAQPRPDDVLHYCLPVCAPYFALQGYKYRVKLAPGQGKKGKAAKLAQAAFLRAPDGTARERDLIRAVPDNDLVAQILGNVRVVTPAATGGGGKGR